MKVLPGCNYGLKVTSFTNTEKQKAIARLKQLEKKILIEMLITNTTF